MFKMRRWRVWLELFIIYILSGSICYLFMNKLVLRTVTESETETETEEPYVEDTFIRDLVALKGKDTEEMYSRSVSLWGVGPLWRESASPNTVLSLKAPLPADCWAFRGSTGTIHLRLPYAQEVKSVGIEHIQPDTAKSAPKQFEIYGINLDDMKIGLLKETYLTEGPARQYYRINYDDNLKEVIFVVLSNYGNENYTCIYRIHLYGRENQY